MNVSRKPKTTIINSITYMGDKLTFFDLSRLDRLKQGVYRKCRETYLKMTVDKTVDNFYRDNLVKIVSRFVSRLQGLKQRVCKIGGQILACLSPYMSRSHSIGGQRDNHPL